ncbi:hypothetical protein [Janibacter sp. GS2]|uniref:hypothetical protein n=1 Tax=Janibacter sp. GS2 TaxID=3442646 RepID=UPI003EBE59DA
MQPSSLIFVLVVAIWAAYLLQYWIKRRDHLATVRSVDRFSAAMRVLDDHRMRRDVAEPTPRSYAVAPTRAARPEVTVKHAQAPQRGRILEPVAGVSRKVRGLTLVSMVLLLPVVLLVTALGPLPWGVSVAWLAGTVGAFGWLRQAVRAEHEAASRPRAETRRAAAPQRSAPRAAPRAEQAAPTRVTRASATAAPFDVADVPTPAAEPVVEESAGTPVAEPEPGTWQPTPVPRPMYTMKAKAERADPPPMSATPATQPGPAVPQVIDVEDEELPAIAGWG